MNILGLLQILNVPYSLEGKNISNGWAGIQCRFCGDHSCHGGFNLTNGYYYCWRCGHHSLISVIQKITNMTREQAKAIIAQYNTPGLPIGPPKKAPTGALHGFTGSLKIPGSALKTHHQHYLISRGFDPNKLTAQYGLLGTGPVGNFKHRIIIPISYNNQAVTFIGRDITGKAELRYKPCPKEEELLPHKHIVYNLENCEEEIVIVEGVTDVWKLGNGSCSTFGISFTTEQVAMIRRKGVKKASILFDNEPQAQKQAIKLKNRLIGFRIETEIINLLDVNDPAELSCQDAKKLMAELLP
jgi:DNA primase